MHRGCHINYLVGALTRHHHVDFGGYGLLAKLELIDDARTFSKLFDFFPGAVVECLAWADGGAHRFPVRRCSVVAHIAFHHQIEVTHHLGYAEWTRQDAIGTGNTPWFACSHDAAILTLFDGIRGADIGARRRVAVHAHHGKGLHRLAAIHVFQVDHGMSFVRLALGTCMGTRLATDAPRRIDKKLHLKRQGNSSSQ